MKEDKIRRREELRRKNKKSKSSKDTLLMILTFFMISAIVILSYAYYLTTPTDKDNSEKYKIEIKESYGASIIANLLYEKDLIKSPTMFKVYSKLSSNSSFYVGEFELSKDMNISDILEVLTTKEKASSGVNLTIIEGENIQKIATKVAQVTDISEEQFLEKVNDKEFISKLKQEFPNLITDSLDDENLKYKLEGYLYPAGYNIDNSNKNNAEALIKTMVKTTNDKVLPLYNQNKKVWVINGVNKNISIHEYITMASILEKESTISGDNNAIAGVFLNRLAITMPLQTDPTVYYSVGRQQSSGVLTIQELQNTDIYNTYVHYGLTPGPISSPSTRSYEALNNAEDHEYLYFLNAKDGKAYFSKTYAEHEELAKKYIEGYIASS